MFTYRGGVESGWVEQYMTPKGIQQQPDASTLAVLASNWATCRFSNEGCSTPQEVAATLVTHVFNPSNWEFQDSQDC